MILLQEVITGRISIWPGTVAGWVSLGIGILTFITLVIGGVWKVGENFRKKLHETWEAYKEELVSAKALETERIHVSIKEMGKRIGENEKGIAEVRGLTQRVEYRMQGLEFKYDQMSKEMTQLESVVENLAKSVASAQSHMEKDIAEMSRAAVRMETTVGLLKDSLKGGK